MQPNPIQLPQVIRTKLAEFARRVRLVSLLRGVAGGLLCFWLGALVVALAELSFSPALGWRIWLSSGNYFLAGAFLIYRVGFPWLTRQSLEQSARALETAANGRFEERILSSVEMAEASAREVPAGVSRWMMEETIRKTAEELQAVDTTTFVDHRPAVKSWKQTSGLLCLLAAACLIPGFVSRMHLALDPYASTATLSKTKLVVSPGSCRIRQGMPLDLTAVVTPQPEQVKAIINWEDGFQETATLTKGQTNAFALGLASVSQGFRYQVQAGDAESVIYTVKVDVPPRISKMQLVIQPPAYTRDTNRIVEGGSADFLEGSSVKLLLETAGEKVAKAEWIADDGRTNELAIENNNVSFSLQPTNPLTYQIRLTGVNQLQSEPSQKWTWTPVLDLPPVARLTGTGLEAAMVQPDEIVQLEAFGSDDVGLKRVDLVVLGKENEADIKSIFTLGAESPSNSVTLSREVRTKLNYSLADIRAQTGEEYQFQVVATDVHEQTTKSEPIAVTIGATDQAVEAQLAARLKQLLAALQAQAEYLKQTRSSWLSIGRNYQEDNPTAEAPAIAMLQSRLNEFGRELSGVGRTLVNESETNSVSEARFMYRLGSTIAVMGEQEREVLTQACGRLDQARGTNVYDVFNRGHEFFNRALLDVAEYQHALSILQGVFETDVLATRCESAQGRYKRGLPVMRGEPAPPDSSAGPGLQATFFEGITLNGKVLEQKTANPRFDNYAPANRRENWSARYEGDVNIPDPGGWSLACISDDGVRLLIDGKSVLPGESWGNHAAQQFKGDLKLTNGWHGITIEFFQGSSENKLQLLAAKQGQPLQEVPAFWLRPPSARQVKPKPVMDAPLSAMVKEVLKERVRTSLQTPAGTPPVLAPFTNLVQNESFTKLVSDQSPTGQTLSSNLTTFASWNPEQLQKSEVQADDLTQLSREGKRILKEALDRIRWHYEGAEAMKPLQNAVEELRQINNELRQLPNNQNQRTEAEQTKLELAKAWTKELTQAATEASHEFFETAKQKEATLSERTTALTAAAKAEKEMQPAVNKLEKALNENKNKEEMTGQIDQRLNEISDRLRELNDLQENMNREQVAAEARKAAPQARAFERAQKARNPNGLQEKYDNLKQAVAPVLKAERVAGNYQDAEKLEGLAGQDPDSAKGKETAEEIRGLASRANENPPSLAQDIPPAMRQPTDALEQHQATPQETANQLAKPRLAMALEAARLVKQGDRKTAVAYELLGQDTGALLESPATLSAPAIKPLTERAAALAGQRGDEARQAEIKAANERLKLLAQHPAGNAEVLAAQLDELSAEAMQAAGNDAKKPPLTTQLGTLAATTPPVANWAESDNPQEIAASAAHESLHDIEAAPKQWEPYNEASQILGDAARQLRMDAATKELADLNPFPAAALPVPQPADIAAKSPVTQDDARSLTRPDGKAIVDPAPKGIDQAEWARLNAQLRKAIQSGGIENFSEEQQAAIRAYFEKLSSEK
jgi:hypothetical protein